MEHIAENIYDYPENSAFGDVPAYGIFIRHARDVVLENFRVKPRSANTRECVVKDDVDFGSR